MPPTLSFCSKARSIQTTRAIRSRGASRVHRLPPFDTQCAVARIYEVFPLLCPMCGGHMRIIAFITHGADSRQILDHIGVDSQPPHISPARGPPLWDDYGDAQVDDGVQDEPDWDLAAQPTPDYEVDQRVNW